MKNFYVPHEVLKLITVISLCKTEELKNDSSLRSIVKLTEDWALSPEERLTSGLGDKYSRFHGEITWAAHPGAS